MYNFSRLLLIAALSAIVCLSWGYTAKICVDAGHGGSDPGASSCNGVNKEKTNTLYTSQRFKAWMDKDSGNGGGGGSWSVVMTRNSDVAVSLQTRCDISNNNGANRFMCIHNNAYNCSAHGTETFCWTGADATTQNLRNRVQSRMINAWALTNRGNKATDFYVLIYTNAPAELAELGFIDNGTDNAKCSNTTQEDIAGRYHLYAIQNHYGIAAFWP